MAATSTVVLQVKSDGTAKIVKEGQAVQKSWVGSAVKIAAAWVALSKTFDLVSKVMSKSLELGVQYTKSQATMVTALKKVTDNVDGQKKSFRKWADQMSVTTEFSSDQVTRLQAMSVAMTGNTKVTNEQVKAAMILNKTFGADLDQALKSVIKSTSGLLDENIATIPSVRNLTAEQRKAGDVARVLARDFGQFLSSSVETVAGRWNNLNTILQDFYLTTVGRAVTDNKVLAAGLEELGNILAGNRLEAEGLRDTVSELIIMFATATTQALEFGSTVFNFLLSITIPLEKFSTFIADIILKPFLLWGKIAEKVSKDLMPKFMSDTMSGFVTLVEDLAKAPKTLSSSFNSVAKTMQKSMAKGANAANKVTSAMIRVRHEAEKTGKELGKPQDKQIKKINKGLKEQLKWLNKIFKIHVKNSKILNERAKVLSKIEEQWRKRAEEIEKHAKISNINFERMKRELEVAEKIAKLFDDINKADKERADRILKRGKFADKKGGLAGPDDKDDPSLLGQVLIGAFRKAGSFIFDNIIQIVRGVFDALKDPAAAKEMLKGVVEMVVTIVQSLTRGGTLEQLIGALVEAVETLIEGLTNETVINRFIAGVVSVVHAILGALEKPGAIGNLVVGFIRLIGEIIQAIIPHAEGIGREIIFAIGRGIIEVFSQLGQIIRDFFKNLFSGPKGGGATEISKKGLETRIQTLVTAQQSTTFHDGGMVGQSGSRRDRQITAQDGEVIIPNAPNNYNGMQSDGNGGVRGMGNVTINISAIDGQSTADWLRRTGASEIIDAVRRGLTDDRGRALGGAF